ncbi:MAG: iron ABC transporter permease [Candidatus Thorarchaeota archaeon]|nr:iron ABC transporter permease [Candidatus Thorarchaeota archaeon]
MNDKGALQWVIAAIPFFLLIAFLVYPVAVSIGIGLSKLADADYLYILSQSVGTFNFTLLQAAVSTLLVVVIGLPGAFVLARLRFRGKSFVRAGLIIPFVLPPIVVVVGFLRVFGSYGVLDSILMALMGSSQSVANLASGISGILLAHTFYNIPLVIMMVSASLERLNPEIEESAEILGAGRLSKLRYIIFPHIRRSLLAASILTFLFCFMSFPIVLALGEGRLMTLEVRIWYAFLSLDFGEASLLALLQIVITVVLAVSYVQVSKTDGIEGAQTSTIRTVEFNHLVPLEKGLVVGYFILLGFLVIGPIASIAQAAFYNPTTGTYSLAGFAALFRTGTGGGLVPLMNTLLYGTLATILSIFLGIPIAYMLRSHLPGLPSLASSLTLLPLGVSAITMAYGLMISIAVPLGLTTNPWILIVIAQTIIGLPFTARAIESALAKIDPAIMEQAEALGASRLQRLAYLELPLMAPGILAGAVFAFAMAIGEMSATYFIALEQNTTLSVIIYLYLGVKNYIAAGAAALMLVAICFVAFLIIEKVSETDVGVNL